MRFIPIDSLPKKRRRKDGKPNKDMLIDFLAMRVKYARMDISDLEYSHPFSAYTSIMNSIRRFGFPLEVRFINDDVYLVNLELED